MAIKIAVISLRAEDTAAAGRFYHEVLGLPVLPHSGHDQPHFDLNGIILTIIHGPANVHSAGEPRFPVVAFSIPDLDEAAEKLRSHGVSLPWGLESNASGRWVMFHDPAGNLVELVEDKADIHHHLA